MRKIIILGFFIVFPLMAIAEITGFEGSGVKTLRVETKVNYFNTKSGEEPIWETRILDFGANRFYQAQFDGADKPEPDELPIMEMVISPELSTLIFHKVKQVIVVEGRGIAAEDLITDTAIRFYNGPSMTSMFTASDVINHASAAGIIEASGEQFVFSTRYIGEQFYVPSGNPKQMRFRLDAHYRVIEVLREFSDGFHLQQYRWERLEPLNVDYLAQMKETIHDSNKEIRMERTVQEIELDPKIPPGLFDLAHPVGYEIKDTRKLLKAPNIPGLGGGAGGAGSSQRP